MVYSQDAEHNQSCAVLYKLYALCIQLVKFTQIVDRLECDSEVLYSMFVSFLPNEHNNINETFCTVKRHLR